MQKDLLASVAFMNISHHCKTGGGNPAVAWFSTMSMNDSSQAVEMSGSNDHLQREESDVFGLELVIRRCPQDNACASRNQS